MRADGMGERRGESLTDHPDDKAVETMALEDLIVKV